MVCMSVNQLFFIIYYCLLYVTHYILLHIIFIIYLHMIIHYKIIDILNEFMEASKFFFSVIY